MVTNCIVLIYPINSPSIIKMLTLNTFIEEWNSLSKTIMVQTSGSTGAPKHMMVEKARMVASAKMTCQFLGLKPHDTALLCMNLDYIAAKMMVVRALTCGMKLVDVGVGGHPMASPLIANETIDFAAMVPLQVYNSLQHPQEKEKLMSVHHLLIGGGALDEKLEEELRHFPHAVWSTYGMTETLSHIALRRVNGEYASMWYQPLEGIHVSADEEHCLIIDAPALCPQVLYTNDIAEFADDACHFRVLGRKDNVICSGGIKIQAEEVERILRKQIDQPFFITGQKDEKYGEIVVMVTEEHDMKKMETIFEKTLPKYWRPKKVITVGRLPLTETGKPKRQLSI